MFELVRIVKYWLFSQKSAFSFLLISQLEKSYQRFTAFYAEQHTGRKLSWLYQMSKGEIVTNCFKNRYTFQVDINFNGQLLMLFKLK